MSTQTYLSHPSNPQVPAVQDQQQEQLARFLWTTFIVMFFVIQAIIWTIAILLTTNDPSHSTVKDFQTRASLPPTRSEKVELNQALGWNVTMKVQSPQSNPLNRGSQLVEVELSVFDKAGLPVIVPSVDLVAFHCSQAARTQSIPLSPGKPGVYHGTMQLHKSGQWQFDAQIKRDSEIYYLEQRLKLPMSSTDA